MPQANITYDTAYNRQLASRVEQMEDDMLWKNKHQYHPSPMGFRMGSFHDAQGTANTPNLGRDYSHSSGGERMTGGAAPSKYILNGNSPAYPPMNMNAGLAVSSGGSREMIGVDGAVSGGFHFGKLLKGVAKIAAPIVGKKLMKKVGLGRGGATSGGATSGGATSGGFWGLAAKLAPLALGLLTGSGRKATMTDKRAAIAQAIEGGNFWNSFKKGFGSVMDLAKKVAPIVIPMMTKLGKEQYGGGFNFGKFLGKIGKTGVGKEASRIGKPLVRKARKAIKKNAPLATAAIKKVADKIIDNPMKTGSILEEAIEKTKPLIRKGKMELKEAIKENAPKATAYLKAKADRGIKKAVGGGRAARAEIVKKVMKERGVKMIKASQIVKAEGLYTK
tara:strand:+ start:4694 stop:5863 length:1170 start_codon:yes stop_codon:yes gene_type:complete